MGRRLKEIEMVCVGCGARRRIAARHAERDGWEAWIGGARCPKCIGKLEAHLERPELAPMPRPPRIFVECAGCGECFESHLEYVDGWRPGIHWVKPSDEQRADARAGRKPLPLCPGWNKGGRVLDVESVLVTAYLARMRERGEVFGG